ncbi:MAG: methanogenesis marker 9 domain-containing protein [Methanobacteriaceae archaeon]|jgi:putative methanogenesis marker domain 9|nr:methanogenesis marker 9 domain-containing protein [Candidatus Methanorudis spinitermitis]
MVWDNSPSHVCRGGDSRALTFCCPPVKPCPILHALDDVNISAHEYMNIKEEFAKNTRLGEGERTCFGSLVWCCKPSKPCPLRDMVLKNIDMDVAEYLTLKKQLSEKLTGKEKDDEEEYVDALADAFSISENEAIKVLQDCDNDLRMAMKLLRMQVLEKSK